MGVHLKECTCRMFPAFAGMPQKAVVTCISLVWGLSQGVTHDDIPPQGGLLRENSILTVSP